MTGLIEFLEENNNSAEVSAQDAYHKIVGEPLYRYLDDGEEFYDELDGYKLRELEEDYQSAKAEHRHNEGVSEEQVLDAKSTFEEAKERYKRNLKIKQLFFHDVAQVRAGRIYENNLLVMTRDSATVDYVRLSKISVAVWAHTKVGIEISDWSPELSAPPEQSAPTGSPSFAPVSWEQITIKLQTTESFSWSIDNKYQGNKSFSILGLMDKRKKKPNKLAGILVGLAGGKKFPTTRKPAAKDSTAMSKLRGALKQLAGIDFDPFYNINDSDGWRPRFKLIDNRKDADNRAKKKAIHTSLDPDYETADAPDFDDVDDENGRFIKNA